jgi:LysM repeat protein
MLKDIVATEPVPTCTITYTVEKGDTLYKIANMFNTTVDEIKRLNNLEDNLLKIGQNLLINN